MFHFGLKESIKLLLFVCTYIGYVFVLYFALSFSIDRLMENKHDVNSCYNMYVYSALFFASYIIEILRYILYVLVSLCFTSFISNLMSKLIVNMFIINSTMLSYGVLLVYSANRDCLSSYDIKDYLCVSGIGLLFSIVTYIYTNYDCFFDSSHSTTNYSLLFSDEI